MKCQKCEYVCDTPLGSYCTLANEAIESTDCHYDDAKQEEKERDWLIRQMR